MTDTRSRIQEDMKSCMKNGDKRRLDILRMLFTEVRNAEINDTKDRGRVRTEDETIALVSAYHKSLAKTLTEYPPEKQVELKQELAIVEDYLPKRLGPDELRALIRDDLKANAERNFGPLMKHFQTKFGAQTEGKSLSEAIKDVLQNP